MDWKNSAGIRCFFPPFPTCRNRAVFWNRFALRAFFRQNVRFIRKTKRRFPALLASFPSIPFPSFSPFSRFVASGRFHWLVRFPPFFELKIRVSRQLLSFPSFAISRSFPSKRSIYRGVSSTIIQPKSCRILWTIWRKEERV